MSLKKLKLAAAAPTVMADPKQHARTKLIRYLGEQKAVAQADIEGRSYSATKIVHRTNETGDRVRMEAPRHIRRGWFVDASGTLFFQIKYGSKPLPLGKDVNAVEVGKLEALPGTIDMLMEAVNAGELDQQLAVASAERKANFKPRAKKVA